jgi:hypothetical protein
VSKLGWSSSGKVERGADLTDDIERELAGGGGGPR